MNLDTRSFRFRLTSRLFAILLASLSLAFFGLWARLNSVLETDFDASLYNYAVDISDQIDLQPDQQPELKLNVYLDEKRVFPFPQGDALVEIYLSSGKKIFEFSLDSHPPNTSPFFLDGKLFSSEESFFNIKESGRVWRSIVMQVDNTRTADVYLVVSVPKTFLQSQKSAIHIRLIVALVATLLLIGFLVYGLSNQLLRPLESLSNQAAHLSENSGNFSIQVSKSVTEVETLGLRLNQLLSQLKTIFDGHQKFVSQAAHQLKTPLTIARGNIEQYLQEPDKKYLKIAIEEIDELSNSISNLLLLTQIESGLKNIQTESVNILDLIFQVCDRFDFLIRKRELKFHVQCDETISPEKFVCETDPLLLKEALMNLLENSIRYTSGSTISISLKSYENFFKINIRNETNKNLQYGGHGLGLHIASKIANLLKHEFSVHESDSDYNASISLLKIKKN